MPEIGKIEAPFSPQVMVELVRYQAGGQFHPYTCPRKGSEHGPMIIEADGLRCPKCNLRQTWVWWPIPPPYDGSRPAY